MDLRVLAIDLVNVGVLVGLIFFDLSFWVFALTLFSLGAWRYAIVSSTSAK